MFGWFPKRYGGRLLTRGYAYFLGITTAAATLGLGLPQIVWWCVIQQTLVTVVVLVRLKMEWVGPAVAEAVHRTILHGGVVAT